MTKLNLQEPQDMTRKQRREQARSNRAAIEKAAAERAAQRRRLRLSGIALAVCVVGILIVVIASAGAGSVKKVAPQSREARGVTGEVTALLTGIPQNGNALGRRTAPVTLQYFGDLQCPVCGAFTTSALPSIIRTWVRAGDLRIEYHSLETATREPEEFQRQQLAALAAGEQDRLWNFVETFYHEQQEEGSGYVTESFIRGIAEQVPGLKLAGWAAQRSSTRLANELSSDAQTANADSLNGTPAFLIGKSGKVLRRLEPRSFTEPTSFNEAIEKSLKA
jgi:protein-disulfide isomerase